MGRKKLSIILLLLILFSIFTFAGFYIGKFGLKLPNIVLPTSTPSIYSSPLPSASSIPTKKPTPTSTPRPSSFTPTPTPTPRPVTPPGLQKK